jgi:hypothetical protein
VDGCCYQKENEEIISSREDKETGLTWKEYKSMTFKDSACMFNGSIVLWIFLLRFTLGDCMSAVLRFCSIELARLSFFSFF